MCIRDRYNAETGEGRGWHGTEFMPDCLFETKCEGGEPETKFFDVNTNEPIKQWSWPEPPDDNAFTNYGSLDEFVANNSQKVFRVVDLLNEIRLTSCQEDMGYALSLIHIWVSFLRASYKCRISACLVSSSSREKRE